MKYNHMLDIAFTIPNSLYENWEDIPFEDIIAAIQKRVNYLKANEQEWADAIGHCDSYEEFDIVPLTTN